MSRPEHSGNFWEEHAQRQSVKLANAIEVGPGIVVWHEPGLDPLQPDIGIALDGEDVALVHMLDGEVCLDAYSRDCMGVEELVRWGKAFEYAMGVFHSWLSKLQGFDPIHLGC